MEFARQLACRAMAYAVEVERRYRGLAPLPDRRAGDGMTTVKTQRDGPVQRVRRESRWSRPSG